jgi:DNA-binding transcriptional LysR family regulator
MIVKFAIRNLGVGCVVEDFAENALNNGQLFELQFKSKIPERNICIISSKQNPISEAAKRLLDMLNTFKEEV